MTNKEMILNVMKGGICATGFQIKGLVYREYGAEISPQSAAGVMRPLVAQGMAAKSPDPISGKMVYWLTDYGKEHLFK